MSGDIGRGTTRESIAFAVRLAAANSRPHGLCADSLALCTHFYGQFEQFSAEDVVN